MDYKNANSSMLAKLAAASLSTTAVLVCAGANPCLFFVVGLAWLAGRCFSNKLGGS